jgi:hypothetical protein
MGKKQTEESDEPIDVELEEPDIVVISSNLPE